MIEETGPLLGLEIAPVAEGVDTHMTVAVIFGITIPVPGPQGMQLAQIPAKVTRFQLNKKDALAKATEILDLANQLADPPPPSKVIVAGSMDGVDKAASEINKFRG